VGIAAINYASEPLPHALCIYSYDMETSHSSTSIWLRALPARDAADVWLRPAKLVNFYRPERSNSHTTRRHSALSVGRAALGLTARRRQSSTS
jgi:hypothetical protein